MHQHISRSSNRIIVIICELPSSDAPCPHKGTICNKLRRPKREPFLLADRFIAPEGNERLVSPIARHYLLDETEP
ncbi:hypothetical protein CEXT_155071 [Caerostris extrusa]|uniref:Uncharacterized protein n=1 Tax=Caerostris extrusa TaxID=172846 RepID=A0AAV4MGY0_CAEEX|nr:hypothetical protein CEXT_155071 [Caerostris extrusa]